MGSFQPFSCFGAVSRLPMRPRDIWRTALLCPVRLKATGGKIPEMPKKLVQLAKQKEKKKIKKLQQKFKSP